MAIQTINHLMIPHMPDHNASGPSFATTGVLEASTEKYGRIIRIARTGTLDKFEFRLGATLLNVLSTFRASFENVDAATGDPDGTQDQFRDMTSLTANGWNVPGLMTSDGTDGGVKRSVTRGDVLACVLQFQTFTALDSVTVSDLAVNNAAATAQSNFPYNSLFTAAWVKNMQAPMIALKYSDGTYEHHHGIWPISALNSTTFNNGSDPDERGLRFKLNAPARLDGFWVRCDLDGDADVVLYDSGGTAIAGTTVSRDTNLRATTAGTHLVDIFPTAPELTANTVYHLLLKPASATNIVAYNFDVESNDIMDAVPGGKEWYYAERTDGGAITTTATKRPWMGLIINGISDGLGGGPVGGNMRGAFVN